MKPKQSDSRFRKGLRVAIKLLERAVQHVPANAVDMRQAKSRPVSQCRTRVQVLEGIQSLKLLLSR